MAFYLFLLSLILYFSLVFLNWFWNGLVSFYWDPLLFHLQFLALFCALFYINKKLIISKLAGIGYLRGFWSVARGFLKQFPGIIFFYLRRFKIKKLKFNKKIIDRLFLVVLLLFVSISFLTNYFVDFQQIRYLEEVYSKYFANLLMALVFAFGMVSFYLNRERINGSISAELALEKRSKNRWVYFSIISLLIVLLLVLSLPLSSKFIGEDEFHLYNVAKGLLETKECIAWNFLNDQPGYYHGSRCFLATIIASFFFLFGESLIVAKIPFLLASILTLIVSYFLIKKLFNKKLALLTVVFFVTNPFFVYQSNYIRAYSFILLTSVLLYFLVFKFLEEDGGFRKKALYLFSISFLTYVGFKLRVFFISFLPALIFFAIIKLGMFLKNIKKRELFVPTIFFSLIVLAPFAAYFARRFNYFLAPTRAFEWRAFNLSFFVYDTSLVKTFILTVFLIASISLIKNIIQRRWTISWEKGYLFLAVIFLSTHFIYGTIVNQTNLIPRFTTHIIPINFMLLFFAFYYYGKAFIKNNAVIYGILLLIILFNNGYFWTHSKINNNYSSTYNYVDMYKEGLSTAHGRLKSDYKKMYEIISINIKKSDKKIALITALFNDPQSKVLEKYKNKVNITS